MKKKTRALLLTALVLPGLGQIYLGRKASGLCLIMLVNLLLLLALFLLLKGSAPIMAAHFTSGSVKPADVSAGFSALAGYGRALLIAFALLWGYAIIDILINKVVESEPERS